MEHSKFLPSMIEAMQQLNTQEVQFVLMLAEKISNGELVENTASFTKSELGWKTARKLEENKKTAEEDKDDIFIDYFRENIQDRAVDDPAALTDQELKQWMFPLVG